MKIQILIILIIFSSCSKKVITNQSSEKLNTYSENISEYLPEYTYVNNKEETIIEEPATVITTDPKNNTAKINAIVDELTTTNNTIEQATGYRILVFSGNNKEDFNAARNYLLSNFSTLEHYESYNQPTYKLKIGDFSSKLIAERYYGQIVNRFSMATIITDKIDVKKSLLN